MEREVDHEGSEDMCAVWIVGSHRMQNILYQPYLYLSPCSVTVFVWFSC